MRATSGRASYFGAKADGSKEQVMACTKALRAPHLFSSEMSQPFLQDEIPVEGRGGRSSMSMLSADSLRDQSHSRGVRVAWEHRGRLSSRICVDVSNSITALLIHKLI